MNIKDITLSVVAPAYNEEDGIEEFHQRLMDVLESMKCNYEIVYVNDGSSDHTLDHLIMLAARSNKVRVIDLSRNFGKEIAMTAGFDHVQGDAVVVIDTDLQDPPELIPTLYSSWMEGYDVVYAQRATRDGESFLKKLTASVFYRLIGKLSAVEIPRDTGDYRLLSRRAVNALVQLREHHRFMKGLFSWVGYSQKAIYYDRDKRFAGETKWNYWKLWNFAIEGFTSFSIAPLKIFSYTGAIVSFISFVYAIIIVAKTLMWGEPVRGYPSLMVVVLFLGGIQLIGIGIVGEYLGRIFNETKSRPLYFVQRKIGFSSWEK